MKYDSEEYTSDLEILINKTIKKVTEDFDTSKFNTAISAIMILVNEIFKVNKLTNDEYKKLILLISPWAPHIANELFEKMGYGQKIEDSTWPKVDESALVLDEIEIPVQVNGKVRGVVKVASDASESDILETAKQSAEISRYLTENIVKVIYVPKKILNIIAK